MRCIKFDASSIDRARFVIGPARKVVDAMGREFTTTYDNDGRVLAVSCYENGVTTPVVTYTYGTSGIEKGQAVGVVDELSGVQQSFTYGTSGSAIGQVISSTEVNGTDSYTVGYGYNTAGERQTSTYSTPQGTTKWGYYDSTVVGDGRAFQTMNKLDASGSRTAEEFHYEYDTGGRLLGAAFAQTPQVGQTDYTSLNPAATRARAYYVYDPAGRTKYLEHYWDTWNSTSYSSEPILGNEAVYETAGLNRGLKVTNRFWKKDSVSNDWLLEREEAYGYDASRDYLISADYGDGLANEEVTWSYDAAGNRASDSTAAGSWSYDNLNRLLQSPAGSHENDLLGNRVSGSTGQVYSWDFRNRLISYQDSATTFVYVYRADGSRVRKESGDSVIHYRHDGQFVIEDQLTSASGSSSVRYGLGLRGIERVENSSGIFYPIYDGSGNLCSTITKSSGSFAMSGLRSYDAWGKERFSGGGALPEQGYAGLAGHRSDGASQLLYMHSRYFEPLTGRFLNEDPARDGGNWYLYCENNPVNASDFDGNAMNPVALGGAAAVAFYFLIQFYSGDSEDATRAIRYFITALTAVTIAATAPRVEPWVLRAGEKMAALMRFDKMSRPDQIVMRMTRNDGRIMFYMGYAIFLIFLMAHLEAWANGETDD